MKRAISGYTLVEMLAAMAVLSILALLIVTISNATMHTTRTSSSLVDAATQSRIVLDRMGQDLGGLIRRNDIDFSAENHLILDRDILAFFSAVPSAGLSPENNRGISYITYQVRAHPENQNRTCLVRQSKAIAWGTNGSASEAATGFMGLKANGLPIRKTDAEFPAALLPTPADFDILAPGVIRIVIGFQLSPDDAPVLLSDGTTVPYSRGQIVYSPPIRSLIPSGGGQPVQLIDLERISAIVTAIVVLDASSLALMDHNHVTLLAEAFPQPADGAPPINSWIPIANTAATNSALAAIPLSARQAITVFQRFYPIHQSSVNPSL